MRQLQKTKKKITYALALMLGSVATFFMIGKDAEINDTDRDYQLINKASADLPYSQSGYGGGGGDADADDAADHSDGAGDADFSPDASDENS